LFSTIAHAGLALLEICIHEAIAIMNDMISETEMRERLTEFHRIRTSNSKSYGGIVVNWWQGQLICFWVGKQWRNVLQGSSIQANIAVSPINRTTLEWAVICDGAPTYHRAFREMKDR
jgi:hypothetical protein